MKKILTHRRYTDVIVSRIPQWKTDIKLKKAIQDFIDDYKNGDVTNRIGSNLDVTIERQVQFLKPCIEWFNKKQINLDNVKKFKQDLLTDKIKTQKKKPFSIRVKKDMLNSFARFLDWYLKDNSPSKPLKVNIKMKKSDPPCLSIDEIDALYNGCKDESERFFIGVLFGSGTRAEEFHNLRYSDIEMPQGENTFVKLRVREQYSKTKGRTISLYYKNCLPAIREFLNKHKGEPEEVVFKESYDKMRFRLIALGKRVLKKSVNYHLFRHSCATWLSDRMNRQQLCIYFGWAFSSPMPDVYIKRKGVNMEVVDKNFKNTAFEELQNKINVLDNETKLKNEELEELKKSNENLKQGLEFQAIETLNLFKILNYNKEKIKLPPEILEEMEEEDREVRLKHKIT
jgi:integrase